MKANAYVLLVTCSLAPVVAAQTQTPQRAEPSYTGRVTGDAVYVRSGPDTNYYAVGKLNRGQIVRVFGERFNWLKIEPLPGMHSLIEENYLDLTADGRGITNADRVNVRAGADSVPHVYARQLKLDRGAEVRILGKREATLNGQTMSFYKIEPPPGAHVWISADYVERATGEPSAAEAPHTEQADAEDAAATERPSQVVPAAPPSEAQRIATPASEIPGAPGPLPKAKDAPDSAALRKQLAEIEDDFKAEFDKPLIERNFQPLHAQLAPLASQEADILVQRYAAVRLEQIEHQIRMIETIRSLRDENRALDELRQEAMQARAEIRVSTIDTPRTFALAGELRRSHVYNTPVLPRRYRLVDPDETPVRTLAYIEIPRNSGVDPLPLLGRYVGINEASRTYHHGLVDAVPIIVPAEIVIIDRPTRMTEELGQEQGETPAEEWAEQQPQIEE